MLPLARDSAPLVRLLTDRGTEPIRPGTRTNRATLTLTGLSRAIGQWDEPVKEFLLKMWQVTFAPTLLRRGISVKASGCSNPLFPDCRLGILTSMACQTYWRCEFWSEVG